MSVPAKAFSISSWSIAPAAASTTSWPPTAAGCPWRWPAPSSSRPSRASPSRTSPTHPILAKIADFGLAKHFAKTGFSGLTLTGTYAGTPLFLPRAQIIDFKYAKPIRNIWSMGATIYSRRVMIEGNNDIKLAGRALGELIATGMGIRKNLDALVNNGNSASAEVIGPLRAA